MEISTGLDHMLLFKWGNQHNHRVLPPVQPWSSGETPNCSTTCVIPELQLQLISAKLLLKHLVPYCSLCLFEVCITGMASALKTSILQEQNITVEEIKEAVCCSIGLEKIWFHETEWKSKPSIAYFALESDRALWNNPLATQSRRKSSKLRVRTMAPLER